MRKDNKCLENGESRFWKFVAYPYIPEPDVFNL